MISEYMIRGDFFEACDCFDLCPCWVNDEPDEDHCLGLVAWRITEGTIDGEDVTGACVTAVTGHTGGRRSDGALTVLFVHARTDEQIKLLGRAFSGRDGEKAVDGALGSLARVTGTVLGQVRPAKIEIADGDGEWSVRVMPTENGGNDDSSSRAAAVFAKGVPKTFDADTGQQKDPLTLTGTALHAELQIQGAADAQQTQELQISVPELPGGWITVSARSGMRGPFHYEHSAP